MLFKQDTPERGVQTVVQHPIMPAKLPILAEYRLAREINHMMMVEKIKHEGAKGKDFKFFRDLPTDVLQEVHDISEEAEKAFRERNRT